jgi:hypothetical protein
MAVSEVTTTPTMPSPINPTAARVRAAGSEEQAIRLRSLIREQARALYNSCEKGSLRDTLIAARWHRWNLYLGVSSAVFAAVAAFARNNIATLLVSTGMDQNIANTHGSEIVSILALISAILTSMLTVLAPSEKAGSYHHFSNKLRSLRDRVHSFMEIDCAWRNKDAALCDEFKRILREKSEIDSSHPIVPHWAYGKTYKELDNKIKLKQKLQMMREPPVA